MHCPLIKLAVVVAAAAAAGKAARLARHCTPESTEHSILLLCVLYTKDYAAYMFNAT